MERISIPALTRVALVLLISICVTASRIDAQSSAANEAVPTLPEAPLLPGEQRVFTAGGCFQIKGPGIANDTVYAAEIEQAQKRTYSGKCDRWLLEGHQTYSDVAGDITWSYSGEFRFGRLISETGTVSTSGVSFTKRYFLDGWVLMTPGADQVLATKKLSGGYAAWALQRTGRTINFGVGMASCRGYPQSFRDCDATRVAVTKDYRVAYVTMGSNHFPAQKGDFFVDQPCSNLTNVQSCLTSTFFAKLKPLLPEFEAAIKDADGWPDRIAALNADYPAAYDAAFAAREKALAAQAARARIAAEQRAQAERDRIAAEQAAAAARAERAAEEDAAFEASLTRLGAGQLFAKADELRTAGDADRARRALRTLISRFPTSPLAATAAQMLAGIGPGTSMSSGPAPGMPAAIGASNVSNISRAAATVDCDGILTRYMQKVSPTTSMATIGLIDNGHRPSFSVWFQHNIRNVAARIGCPASYMARIDASIVKLQGACRQSTPADNCEAGTDYRPADWRSRDASALAAAEGEAGKQVAGIAPGATPAALLCRQKLREDDAAAGREDVSGPKNEMGYGVLLINQYAMFLYQRRIGVLDTYCQGQPEYMQRAKAQQGFDIARSNCAKVSSTGSCPGPVQPPLK